MYDLNVVWPTNVDEAAALRSVKRSLLLLAELGYKGAALNYVVTGKFKGVTSPFTTKIMSELQEAVPKFKILKRVTLIFDEVGQNQTFTSLGSQFDIIAVQPGSEKSLQSAATALDIDVICLSMTKRLPFYIKHKIATAAVDRGLRFEVTYAGAVTNPEARRHNISNAASIIRATRGRGIILSSGMTDAANARAPFDAINLITIWGLDSQRARHTIDRNAKAVAVNGLLRSESAKQVVVCEERPAKRPKLSI